MLGHSVVRHAVESMAVGAFCGQKIELMTALKLAVAPDREQLISGIHFGIIARLPLIFGDVKLDRRRFVTFPRAT